MVLVIMKTIAATAGLILALQVFINFKKKYAQEAELCLEEERLAKSHHLSDSRLCISLNK
jgi:hypothetical protein